MRYSDVYLVWCNLNETMLSPMKFLYQLRKRRKKWLSGMLSIRYNNGRCLKTTTPQRTKIGNRGEINLQWILYNAYIYTYVFIYTYKPVPITLHIHIAQTSWLIIQECRDALFLLLLTVLILEIRLKLIVHSLSENKTSKKDH